MTTDSALRYTFACPSCAASFSITLAKIPPVQARFSCPKCAKPMDFPSREEARVYVMLQSGQAEAPAAEEPASTAPSLSRSAPPPSPVPKPEPAPATAQEPVVTRGEPVATPVPEQFVSQAPAPIVAPARTEHESVVARIVFGAQARYRCRRDCDTAPRSARWTSWRA